MTNQSHIRNFSIIAHIDHGKSTLSDRLIEACDAVEAREMESQLLDNMDLERERGITIKARAVRLQYKAEDGETYELNLIDTPGHVDFNYEVSRSLAACEGAVLVVDAAQGIEAQTLANTYLAMEHDLEIRPVLNKIDLPAADPQRVKREIEDIIGLPALDAPEISAKQGINIPAVLEDIVNNIPAPSGDREAPLKALIFDSQYDPYLGVIVYFRVMEGALRPGMQVKLMASGAQYNVLDCGYLRPLGMESAKELSAGEVGWFTASIKNVKDTSVGDTITGAENPAETPLPATAPPRPWSTAASTPRTAPSTPTCGTRWKSCGSTTREGWKKGSWNPESYAVKNWVVRLQGVLITCATDGFTSNYERIMAGEYDRTLFAEPAEKS